MTNREALHNPPHMHPLTSSFLEDADRIREIHAQCKGTVNIVFPEIIQENYYAFKSVLEKRGLQYQIQYAHKPNKSLALASALASIPEARIDVASEGELESALRAGFEGTRISGGGPKNATYIASLITHGASIVIDSLTELHLVVQEVQRQEADPHPVFVRLNVDSVLSTGTESRFGIIENEIEETLSFLVQEKEKVQFMGFAFHINADAIKLRKPMITRTLEYTLSAQRKGLRPTSINIGGGFGINYSASGDAWNAYTSALIESVRTQEHLLGWNKSGLGYWSENGVLRGTPQFAESFHSLDQYAELEEFLTPTLDTYHATVADVLADHMITLIIEPGRALLDNAGISVTRILDVKKSSLGNTVLVVDMNRSQLGGNDQMYMPDPILISQEKNTGEEKPFPTFIAGNLCMKSDLIFRHKTWLPHIPKRGDLLVFINTAAYYMDFTESRMLMQPLAPKYAAYREQGNWEYREDQSY